MSSEIMDYRNEKTNNYNNNYILYLTINKIKIKIKIYKEQQVHKNAQYIAIQSFKKSKGAICQRS